MSSENIKDVVKEKYGQAALRVVSGSKGCCGGGGSADQHCADAITSNLGPTTSATPGARSLESKHPQGDPKKFASDRLPARLGCVEIDSIWLRRLRRVTFSRASSGSRGYSESAAWG